LTLIAPSKSVVARLTLLPLARQSGLLALARKLGARQLLGGFVRFGGLLRLKSFASLR